MDITRSVDTMLGGRDNGSNHRRANIWRNRREKRRALAHAMQLTQSVRTDYCVGGEVRSAVYETDLLTMEKSGFTAMTLRAFIARWSQELCDYYGEDFGDIDKEIVYDFSFGDTLVFVIVDNQTSNTNEIPLAIKKKLKKAGKWRRDKLRHQWSYLNPLNRIQGFLVMKDVTNTQILNSYGKSKCVFAIDTVCSTYFTEKKGIGTDLMNLALLLAREIGATDVVLEVANEYSAQGMESSDEETDDEESDDEESDDEESDDEESDDEESDDEDKELWFPDEGVIDILSNELWKKCMRKNSRGIPYYNLDQDYISENLRCYFETEKNAEEDEDVWSGYDKNIISDVNDPNDSEYGGFWYNKGKRSQARLMSFYEMFGFREDLYVHTDWCCFGGIPYPTMRLSIK